MREIKFRAWDKIGKFMAYLENVEVIGSGMSESSHRFAFDVNIQFSIPSIDMRGKYQEDKSFFDLSNIKLMQYTGLKDKRGKEIYEGDILKVFDDNEVIDETLKVQWEEDGAGFNMVSLDGKYLEWEYNPFTADFDMEILGNIYENPELIPNHTK